ncbi:MAG: flagellar filament capping protein FliD [Thermodesulfovibrionales bacterium]|nr:flagellar filament capping protein FliD [Thermodesulfovibrionales bacterium]
MADNIVSGLFSGIDTASIVSKLIAIEKKPLYALQRKKTFYEKQISSYGDLLSKLSAIKDSLSFFKDLNSIPLSASSSNTSMLSVSASSEALTGIYEVEINQLAKPHRIISFYGVASERSPVVSGPDRFFRFKVGESGEVHEIALTEGMSLLEFKDAINNKNAGLTASIINTGSGENPYKLIISSNSTGEAKNIVVLQDDTIFDNNFTDIQRAQNAIFKINGVEMQRSSNTISDVIKGVTLTLNKADGYSSTITVTVAQDTAVLKNKFNIFVAQYNAFINLAKSLTAKGQIFSTDISIDYIINNLRGVTTAKYNDNILVNLGLTHDKSGILQVNDSIFEKALSKNLADVVKTLQVMSESLNTNLSNIINSIIPSRREGLKENIKSIEKSISLMEIRISKKEEGLKKKFAQLEQTVGSLQSRGDYLVQQLAKMSKTNRQ